MEQLCDNCIKSKYIKIIKYKKMTLIIYKLQEIHVDLWGPYDLPLLSRKGYVSLFLNEYTYKSWILLFQSKDKFYNIFKLWLPYVQELNEKKFRSLSSDGGEKSINVIIESFYNEKSITIGYTALYIHKENGIAKLCLKTLATIKDSLLIANSLPVSFWAHTMDTVNNICNWLPRKRSGLTFVLKEIWT